MELLFWPLLGALIGFYAAQKNGFSTVGGVIGGMLLGPLALLLCFVTGIVSSSEQQRKCPYCAEWIRPEATVCKHCHRDVPPIVNAAPPRQTSLLRSTVRVLVAVVVAILVIGVLGALSGPLME
jgi:hypothetical protein